MKHCPFCGHTKLPRVVGGAGGSPTFVKCRSCGATGPDGWRKPEVTWETRAAEPAPPLMLPMDTAPKDHTLVRLLVDYSDAINRNPLADSNREWTIGQNGYDHTGTDEWQFVGWDWCQDCFVDATAPHSGVPLGWLPLTEDPEA